MKIVLFLLVLFSFTSCSSRKLLDSIYMYEASGTVYDCDENKIPGVVIKFTDFEEETTTDEDGEWNLTASNMSKCEDNTCNFSLTYKLNNNNTVTVNRTKGKFVLNGLKYSKADINFYINKNNSSMPCIIDDDTTIIDEPLLPPAIE